VGSEALRAVIESEGRARAAAILRAAEEEASRLRTEAAARARQRHEDALREEEAALRRDAETRTAAARARARKRVLEARDEFLARVFALAGEALSAEIEKPAARAELLARLEHALSLMPPESPVLVAASTGVAPWLEAALAGRDGVRVESDPELPAGFRVVGAGGAIVIDAPLVRLLEASRPALAIELLRRLDGERRGET
jgi:vacuolar-type H+-ATPase subunit E/Vma4